METLGMRLARYRKQTGLTQAELAVACAWENGQGRIGNYERDKREPNLDDLRKLSKVLNRSLSDIIEGEQSAKNEWNKSDFLIIPAYIPFPSKPEPRENSSISYQPSIALNRRLIFDMKLNLDDLEYFDVTDSSMQPTINMGDIAILDLSKKIPDEKNIYAIETVGNVLTMRRFSRDVSGKWLARRDNIDKRFYPDEEISEQEITKLGIRGRIVWHGGAV